nr:uncharacterized protein LOC108944351 [Nicotiana tomentosiformis]
MAKEAVEFFKAQFTEDNMLTAFDIIKLQAHPKESKVLGRSLDALFDDPNFIGFGMPKWSKNINYLSYADDTIIFSSSHYGAIQLIMNVPEDYEADFGQKVNKEKSSFYMHENSPPEEANTVHLITTFQRHPFPFTYLGCTIFYSRRKKEFYKGITFKVQQRLHSWKGRILSFGGRVVLIAHIVWSNSANGRAKHWASWATLCLPKVEGGARFRSLHDVSKALFAKL